MSKLPAELAAFERASSSPDSLALHVDGKGYTYAELVRSAAQLSAALSKLVVRPGSTVGILSSRSLESCAGVLGCLAGGFTYVPLNPKLPVERIRSIIQNSALDAVIVGRESAVLAEHELIDSLPSKVIIPRVSQAEFAGKTVLFEEEVSALVPATPNHSPADSLAYVMFTSGTTGQPKGVKITRSNLRAFIDKVSAYYKFTPEDRFSGTFEISFDVSIFDLFVAWNAGASVHIVPESLLFAPVKFINERQLTVWASVPSIPSMMTRMKLLKPNLFPTLKVSYFAGEPLSKTIADVWQHAAPNSAIDDQYGPTEATVTCIMQRYSDDHLVTPGRDFVAIGRVYPEMHAEIVDGNAAAVKTGEIGELILSGDQVSTGYLNDPELTAKKFRSLAIGGVGARIWYFTGDRAYKDKSGVVHHLGRVDNQIKVLGHRIELEDVEAHLKRVCGTESCACVAWPVENGSAQGVVAFISGKKFVQAEIQNALKMLIPAYAIPRKILAVAEIPLSLNGKVDRAALVKLLEKH